MMPERQLRRRLTIIVVAIASMWHGDADPIPAQVGSLPQTGPLTAKGDIASELVDGVDRFLLRKLAEARAERVRYRDSDFSDWPEYEHSITASREKLTEILGAGDGRMPPRLIRLSRIAGTEHGRYSVFHVRWQVLEDPDPRRSLVSVSAEGLLLEPNDPAAVRADIVALPDCEVTPTQAAGLRDGLPPDAQFARRLAEKGCRVLVPMLVNRQRVRPGGANLTNREFVYRGSFELGRHLIGYEVQKTRAAIDWFLASRGDPARPTGIVGSGEGGRIALFTAALDTRVQATCIGAAFDEFESVWEQPLDRNVFGLLKRFGAAELLAMIAPRQVLINHVKTKIRRFAGNGGAPAVIRAFDHVRSRREVDRARKLVSPLTWSPIESAPAEHPCDRDRMSQFFTMLTGVAGSDTPHDAPAIRISETAPDESRMQSRTIEELDRHNQLLLRESPFVRNNFMERLNTKSVAAYQESAKQYRRVFREQIIGEFDERLLPLNPRTRKSWEGPNWVAHEVVLDVFPDVQAYGVLLLPRDLKPDDRRPVVVCQHGLEGRPTDTFLNDHRAYHDFAARLADRGFITFAPQNLYIFRGRFRTLQRKANPLGKTLFSIMVPQHQQIVNWLGTLPYVDQKRIAFYGLSYGGKSAMRIPALVTDYCLSICSADFNEWVTKNASTRHRFSYMWTGEYEIFEWNLGSTFNYSEMAALICPRPFMVERGHFDGVGKDEWVAHEYAKVRHLYSARLGIGHKTRIEWFAGPHTINGKGTFDFLHQQLQWPRPEVSETPEGRDD